MGNAVENSAVKDKKILIIGGGLGGLFTGALLAKNGAIVRVLEKNVIIGGGLQCFSRNGKSFETGMHIVGGFRPGGTLYKLSSYLGILDRLQLEHLEGEYADTIFFADNNLSFRLPSGRENFTKALISYFPDEEKGIKGYIDAIFSLSDLLPLYNLRERCDYLINPPEEFVMPADMLIARYVSDPTLRALLAYHNSLYDGVKEETPAFIHAVINTLYITGQSRFIGGSLQLASALAEVIINNGGEVLSPKEVISLEMLDNRVISATTGDGKVYTADYFISAIHPATLSSMMPPHAFKKSYSRRLNEIPNSCSAFSLYIDLKPGAFPYLPHTNYYIENENLVWQQEKYNRGGEIKAFMYMTPPDQHQGEYASRLLVYSLMSFDEVREWENSSLGNRGEGYEVWKKGYKDYLLDKLEHLYPGFRNMILHTYSASPLTIRDYYNTKEGAIFGYRKVSGNMAFSHIPAATKIPNLLLTGQNIGLHGICGVPINAIITAEELLGKNFLVREINRCVR